MAVFSKVYRDALKEKRLHVSLTRVLRRRLWKTMQYLNQDYSYHPTPGDNWMTHTSVLDQVPEILKREYGADQLFAYDDDNKFVPAEDERLVTHGTAAQVLDWVQVFLEHLGKIDSNSLRSATREINRVFEEESSVWRFIGDSFVKIDSNFAGEILRSTNDLLDGAGYAGAQAEFREAQTDLSAGDTKGAIRNACSAFESAMKTLLGEEKGTANDLAKRLKDEGYLDDLPESVRSSFAPQVLMALPFLGNRLGRHGQGATVVEVPQCYAELAVHLSGAFISFCIHKSVSQPHS